MHYVLADILAQRGHEYEDGTRSIGRNEYIRDEL
jgi:hypothetical protein